MMSLNYQMVLIWFQIFKIMSNISLKIPEAIKVFGSTKNVIDKTKNGEKVPSLQVLEVVLVQSSLSDNRYEQESEL